MYSNFREIRCRTHIVQAVFDLKLIKILKVDKFVTFEKKNKIKSLKSYTFLNLKVLNLSPIIKFDHLFVSSADKFSLIPKHLYCSALTAV